METNSVTHLFYDSPMMELAWNMKTGHSMTSLDTILLIMVHLTILMKKRMLVRVLYSSMLTEFLPPNTHAALLILYWLISAWT